MNKIYRKLQAQFLYIWIHGLCSFPHPYFTKYPSFLITNQGKSKEMIELASSMDTPVEELFFLFSIQVALVLFVKCTTISQELIPDYWKVTLSLDATCACHHQISGNDPMQCHKSPQEFPQSPKCQGVLTQLFSQAYPTSALLGLKQTVLLISESRFSVAPALGKST